MEDFESFDKDGQGQPVPQTPETDSDTSCDDEKKGVIVIFGHALDTRKAAMAGLGGLLAIALIGGGIWCAAARESEPKSPAPNEQVDTQKQPFIQLGTMSSTVIERVEANAEADPNTDTEKIEEESQEVEEGMTGEPSNGGNKTPATETGGNGNSGSASGSGNGGDTGSNAGSGSSNNGGGSKPQHTHNWAPQTTVVHHDAQYQTIHHDAVYGTGVECNGCFAQFNSYDAWLAHSDSQLDNGNSNCMGYHTIKTVLEQAWDETVEVSPAWNETVTTGYACSCGAVK